MSNNIQLQSIFGKPLYPRIKTSNVINDAGFLAVSDSGSEGQFLIQTAEGPKWVTIQQSQLQSSYRYFSQAPQNLVTFQGLSIPVGVEAPSGNYYPVEKNSLSIGSSSVTLDITAYLAYQDTPSISGLWRAWFSSGGTLSDSFSLSDYYTKSQVDDLIAGNITERTAFVPFSSVTDNKVTFTGCGIPTGVLTPSGSYYSIQKSSVEYNKQLGRTVLDVSAYLAYQDMASFSGTWTACFPAGIIGSNSAGYYTKQEVDDLFAQLSDSIQNTYYTKSEMDEKLQRNNMPIGTIFYYPSSVPPEGAFLLNGQIIYNCSTLYPEFYQYVTSNNGIRKITSSVYESELSSIGMCGGFVVDSENGSIRLPAITSGFIEGSNGSNVGTSIKAGLPNITGNIYAEQGTFRGYAENNGGALSYTSTANTYSSPNFPATAQGQLVTINASRSSAIYGNSNTVQPNAVCYSVCIQVFNTALSLSNQVSAQLATELQSKAGINAENFTAAGKDSLINIMSDFDVTQVTSVAALSTYYTATKAGILYASFTNSVNATTDCYISAAITEPDVTTSYYSSGGYVAAGHTQRHSLFIPKGQQYRVAVGNANITWSAYFIPLRNSIATS